MKSHIEHFGCKSCGGTLGIRDGERVVVCKSCGVRNLVEIDEHIPRYTLSPLVSLDEAKRCAMRLTREKGLAPDLPEKSRFYDAGLYYLPHFELTGVRTGKMIQTDIQKRKDGFGNEKIIETSRASVLMADIFYNAPAVRLGDWGIENVPLQKQRQAQKLTPFDPGRMEKDAHIFDPNIAPETFESERSAYEGYLPGDQTKIVQKTLHIVYSPVWLIKYTYHDRLYRIIIDAILGEVVFARAPKSDSDRVLLMMVIAFMLTYPVARAARFLVTQPFSLSADDAVVIGYYFAIPGMIILSFILVALAMAWNQFRYSGEVIFRGEVREVEQVNKPPETKIEQGARFFTKFINRGLEQAQAMKVKSDRWYD